MIKFSPKIRLGMLIKKHVGRFSLPILIRMVVLLPVFSKYVFYLVSMFLIYFFCFCLSWDRSIIDKQSFGKTEKRYGNGVFVHFKFAMSCFSFCLCILFYKINNLFSNTFQVGFDVSLRLFCTFYFFNTDCN